MKVVFDRRYLGRCWKSLWLDYHRPILSSRVVRCGRCGKELLRLSKWMARRITVKGE